MDIITSKINQIKEQTSELSVQEAEIKAPVCAAASLTLDQQKKLMEILTALPLKLSEISKKEN